MKNVVTAELRAACAALLQGASRIEAQLPHAKYCFELASCEAYPTITTAPGRAADEAVRAAEEAADARTAAERDAHLRRCLAALDAYELLTA